VEVITADLDGTGKATLSTFDESAAEAEAEAPAKARNSPRRTPSPKPASTEDVSDEIRLF
jgi:hypothetical protein